MVNQTIGNDSFGWQQGGSLTQEHEFSKCKVLLFSGRAATSELVERAQKKGRTLQFARKRYAPEARHQ